MSVYYVILNKPGVYQKIFRQGATIVPRSFFFVRANDLSSNPDLNAQYWVETDPEQAEDAKPPYDEIRFSGLVEGRFLFTSALSKHLLPFAMRPLPTILLPLEEKHGQLTLRTPDALTRDGYRDVAKWMREAEQVWREKRESKADKQTLTEWLDYQGKLTAQSLSQRHLVLYNAAGTNVSAAYFDRGEHPRFICEHKLYWAAFSDPQEAHYVTAVLNAKTANDAIKPFQSTGLMGERDIEKKLLELPIPPFNVSIETHRQLAELGTKAHEQAASILRSGEFPAATSIARQRTFIRDNLASTFSEIDKLVRKLLQALA